MRAPAAQGPVIRCSSLPQLTKCSAPLRVLLDGDTIQVHSHGSRTVAVDPTEPAAALGTAVHAALRAYIDAANGEVPSLLEIAEQHGLDIDTEMEDFKGLFFTGRAVWDRHLKQFFARPITEFPIDWDCKIGPTRFTLAGHIDVIDIEGSLRRDGMVSFVDWKSGRLQSDYAPQMAGYAYLVMKALDAESVSATTVFLRSTEYINVRFSKADLERWFKDELAALLTVRGIFRPGEHCAHCAYAAGCEGRSAVVAQAVRDLAQIGEPSLPTIAEALDNPELRADLGPQLRKLWDFRGTIRQAIEDLEDRVRESIAHNGPIALGDGREIRLEESERTTIDPVAAWPVLQTAGMTDADLGSCVRILKGEMQEAVIRDVPRGQKRRALELLDEALRAAGAITTTRTVSLKTAKAQPVEEIAE